MTKKSNIHPLGIFGYHHENPPAPFNSEYDPTAKVRELYVSDLVEFYEHKNGRFNTYQERAAYRKKLLDENQHVKQYEINACYLNSRSKMPSFSYWLECKEMNDNVSDTFQVMVNGSHSTIFQDK